MQNFTSERLADCVVVHVVRCDVVLWCYVLCYMSQHVLHHTETVSEDVSKCVVGGGVESCCGRFCHVI